MTRIKLLALFVAVVGTGLYFYSYLHEPETWDTLNRKGVLAFKQTHYAEAEEHLMQALKLAEQFPHKGRHLYFSLYRLVEVYQAQSKFTSAEQALNRILKMDEEKFGHGHPNVAFAFNNLASNYRMRGNYEEAEVLLKQALQILESSMGRDHVLVGNILEHYSHLLRTLERITEAEKMESRYQEIFSKHIVVIQEPGG
jgi:tetratricopeptide (TPR) repeat protein